MDNSPRLPLAALCATLLLALFTVASIAVRNSEAQATSAVDLGDVSTGPYKGSRFWSAPAAQQVPVAADPAGGLRWEQADYRATAGDVTFVVGNASPGPHQFAIEGNGLNYQSGNLGSNTTTTLTLKNLPPGDYLIVCNFPGHRESGMIAKLTVT